MDLGGISPREGAYLVAHKDASIAAGHGALWTVDTALVAKHRPPMGARALQPDEDGTTEPMRVARLVPLVRRSRRSAARTLRGWGLVWLVGLVAGGQIWADDPDWLPLAVITVTVTMIVPGMVLALTAPPARVTVLPLEVIRDRVDADGLHAVELRDVDGSTVSLTATPPLATMLLLASDDETAPLMSAPSGGTAWGVSAAEHRRERTPDDLLAAPALVNPAFPSEHYEGPAVAALLERAARVAGVSVEEVAARAAALVPAAAEDVLESRGDVDAAIALHTRRGATQSCAWAILAPAVIAVCVSVLAPYVEIAWPWAS
ncbi:MAG: hypothetical protein ACK5IM_12980 [Demequina sp.]|uniref:hypothetical protein n=1 Tax=Demequina sp. TaxID=2050685 RepID=UPI003A86426D